MSGAEGCAERSAFVVVQGPMATDILPLVVDRVLYLDASGAAGATDAVLALRWDGHQVQVDLAGPEVWLGGKRLEAPGFLKAGDEVQLGRAQAVVGVSIPLAGGGRRALTHHEFRERLYEELARASRNTRATALVMVSTRPGEGQTIAHEALEAFRGGDVVGTYATDHPEFLLPDTDRETAILVVRRLLEKSGVDAAMGVAVAPDDGETPERLLRAARRALAAARVQGGGVSAPPPKSSEGVRGLTPMALDGASKALVTAIQGAASHHQPVLLLGERSVGKSVYARLLHQMTGRSGRFVICHGATFDTVDMEERLSAALVEAVGGTFFIEEVAELPVQVQRRIADSVARIADADVRLIMSTERAPEPLVERGAFDASLWRHCGCRVDVPPLRSRPDDIVPLAQHFAAHSPELALRTGQGDGALVVVFSAGAIARLRSYPWPGNVLELRNAVERAVCLAGGGTILAEHLPSEPMPIHSGDGRLRQHVDGVERDAIIRALADTNHNQTHAAKRLGVSRRALIYKMEKYGLKRPPRSARGKGANG